MKIYSLCSLSWNVLCFGTTDFWLGSDATVMKSVERQKQLVRFDYADNKPSALGEEITSD